MRYLVSVIDDVTGPDTPAEEAAVDVFNERLQAEGHWVFAGGLGAPETATVMDNRGGDAVTARVSASGELGPLDEQDRTAWDAALTGEGHRLVRERLAAAAGVWPLVATRSWRRSTPCTPPPGMSATPTGPRSSPCTTSSFAWTPRPSSPSTGPSRSPNSTAPRWHWRPWIASTTPWPAITPTTRPAPTCCAGWAAPEARAAYDEAVELAGNSAEIAYLTRRRDQLGSSRPRQG